MFGNEFSRRDMVLGGTEAGNFILELMDSDRVTKYNSDLQHRNFMVIKWLEEHGAPTEMVAQARDDAAQGNNAILTLYDEIRLGGIERSVIPTEALELFFEVAGPKASALFNQLCEEYLGDSVHVGGKDCREQRGRQEKPPEKESERL